MISAVRRAVATFIATANLCACTETVRVLLPDPPPGSRAALIALEYQNQLQVSALALDRPDGPAPTFPFAEHFRGQARIVVLYYQQDLGGLSLKAGVIPRAESVDRGRLSRADYAFATLVLDDHIDPFEPLDPAHPGELIENFELDVQIAHDCIDLDARVFELDTFAAPQALIRYDARTALVATELGEFFLVTSSSVARAQVSVDPLVARPVSAFRAPSGEIWLGGQEGVVLRGDLARGFAVHEIRDHGHQFLFLDGPRDPALVFELYGITTDGEFDRYDSATDTWTMIEDFNQGSVFSFGAMVWLGPEHAVTTPPFSRQVVRYDHGSVSALELPPAQGELRTLFQLHDGTLIAIADPATVFRIEREGYEQIAEAGEAMSPRSAAPLGDGFVYLATGGALVQWQPVDGYCPIEQVAVGGTIPLRTVELDDAILVLGSDRDLSDGEPVAPRITVLQRSAPR